MKRLLLAVGLMVGAGQVVGAGAQEAEALTQKEALQKLSDIKTWSQDKDSKIPESGRIRKYVAALSSNPEVSIPILAEAFADKAGQEHFRLNCGQLLREIARPLPPKFDEPLDIIIHDNTESTALRIYAAHLRLAPGRSVPAAVKNSIADMADGLLRTSKDDGTLRLLIFSRLVGSDKAAKTMIRELRKGKEVDSTIWALGKIKVGTAVLPISEILSQQGYTNRPAPTKVRGYLALGEIGGSKSYDLLNDYLAKEKNGQLRRVAIRAIGATRDPRAKALLLNYLLHKPSTYYTTALDALRYLGDASVIPILNGELSKPLEEFERSKVRSTIASIEQGPAKPEW